MSDSRPSRPAAPRPTRGASSLLGQWPLFVVVGGIVAGLVVVGLGSWRVGAVVIGIALCVGAVERVALPRRETGLLLVRGKLFDTVTFVVLGVGVLVLAYLVPQGRGPG